MTMMMHFASQVHTHTLPDSTQVGIEQNLFKLINYIRTRISPSFPAAFSSARWAFCPAVVVL